MEWKLFEECKGHSRECDIHEMKHLDGAFCLFLGRWVEQAAPAKELNALSEVCRVIRIIREIKETFSSTICFEVGTNRNDSPV